MPALASYQACIVTDEEAVALATLFGPDGCYGLAWFVLHLIETAPGWPLEDASKNSHPRWRAVLRQRLANVG